MEAHWVVEDQVVEVRQVEDHMVEVHRMEE